MSSRSLLARTFGVGVVLAATALSVVPAASASPTPTTSTPHATPKIIHEEHHDASPALRTIAPKVPAGGSESEPVGKLPHPKATAHDPVVQHTAGAQAPTVGANFDGVGTGFSGPAGSFSLGGVPPDPNSAVGATQVVEIVNSGFAVFSKSGTTQYGPASTNTLFTGFGGFCESTDDGDAVARYDSLANRWVITQFANVRSASGPYYECVAVSQTSDATGAYNRYSFQYSNFPDYPKLSVWPDAYYVTYNMFSGGGATFAGAESCAMDRAGMLAGTTATQQCFTTSSSYGGILASDVDGTTPPPQGADNVQLALGTTSTTLAYWRFHVDWANTANTTFSGPTNLTVAAYTPACGSSGTCVPQKGTSQTLDSLSDRLMFRLVYRNFGDHQSLVTSHSVTVGSSVGERWYEFRLGSGGNPTVYQQGTYAPDSTYRWLGSVAMDKAGNMALGYTASSSSINPQIRLTGRLAGDTLGQMTQGESTIVAGTGSQTTYSRWGDYSSMSVDPTDGCTFWYTHEYLATTGARVWKTRNASFTLPGCTTSSSNDFSISTSPASGSVTAGSPATTTVSTAVTAGVAGSVSLAASGLPAGASASFAPASVTAGNASTLTISTSASTPAGTYPVTITGTEGTASHTASYSLTVTSGSSGGGIANGDFESGSLTGWTTTGTAAAVNSGAHGGTYAARVGSTSPSTDSSIAQTFTAPTGSTQLSFWYNVVCPDTVTYDWATVTLKDTTTGTTTTPLGKTCTNGAGWKQVTAAVTAGHGYTLTLASHDDNYAGDPTYTLYDDVTLTGASTPPPGGPVQLSSDPYSSAGAQHATEAEPDTFSWGNTVVAATQVGRYSDGGADNIGWATSTDGGSTWQHGFLPGITTVSNGQWARVSDPAVAYDAKHGTWLVSGLFIDSAVNGRGVSISTSSDGLTWSNPVIAAGNNSASYDKEWVACDDTASSPHYGTCYVEVDVTSSGNQIVMVTSTDGGQTWSAESSPADTPSGLGGQPLVQPNGTVVVPYSANQSAIRSFTSTDGGASWNASVLVSNTTDHAVTGMREEPMPSAEIDAAGTVYVVWDDCRFRSGCGSNDIVMSTSTDGATWSAVTRIPIDATTSGADHFTPGIGVDRTTSGGTAKIGLAYYFYPDAGCSTSTCQLEVGYVSSVNGGSTWSAPQTLAGPMSLSWLAQAGGAMVGDYISTSIVGGKAVSAFAVGAAPSGSTLNQYLATGGPLTITGGSLRASADGVQAVTRDRVNRPALPTVR